jgi:glycosyltransferase involved in cell wall biosynthesis
MSKAAGATLVRVLMLHPEDVVGPTIGGVVTFIRDFVRFSPEDFEIHIVGTTSDALARPVGRWIDWKVGDRHARFLPLVKGPSTDRHSRMPAVLRFTAAVFIRRQRIPAAGRNLQFHRAEVALGVPGNWGPNVQVIHVDVHLGNRENRWRYLPGVYRRVEDVTLRRMARVFVANDAGARFYRMRHPRLADRVSFLSGWYDDTLFRAPTPDQRDALREGLRGRLGVEVGPGDKLVMFAGRLEKQKDPEAAIRAFAALRSRFAGRTRLLVIGEGSLLAATQRRAAEEGVADAVEFLGPLQHAELPGVFAAGDALLLPSRWEGGGPRVVLEAMACGVPVVATTVGEVGRVVHSGMNGWIAENRRPETLAAGLRWVLEQPRDAIGEAAAAAARPFSARRVLTTLYDAHRAIADTPRRT